MEPHLKSIPAPQHKVLFEAGDQIRFAYFPLSAAVSIVVSLSTGELVELAMIGRDGVIGASAALGDRLAQSQAIVQLGGEVLICDIDALRRW